MFAMALLLLFMVNCNKKKQKRFTELDPSDTQVFFENVLDENENFSILDYLYFYNGGGIAAGDINNDGLVDLYFTSNQGVDRLYLNLGELRFKDITETSGVGGETGNHKWTTGATMVDVNADGLLDIYVCEVNGHGPLKGKNRLYINQGDERFVENAQAHGLDIATFSQQAAFFDMDKDGDLDMFLLNHAVHTPDSYKRSDIREKRDELAGDRLYRNDDGYFIEITETAGIYTGPMGYGLSVSIADVNNDSWPDIYVGNDFHENDYLYYNRGDGTFEEAIAYSTKYNSTFTMGSDIADVNNDGLMDIFTLDMKPGDEIVLKRSAGVDSYDIYNYKINFGYHHQYSRNMFQINRGKLLDSSKVVFNEIGQIKGLDATDWSWGAIFDDLDNNGFKDLYVTNGIPRRPNDLDFTNYTSNEIEMEGLPVMDGLNQMPEGSAENHVFGNDNSIFTDRSKAWGLNKKGYSNGALALDLDNDGDMDIVTNNLMGTASLFKNNTVDSVQGSNYISIRLHGRLGNANGIGARVTVFTDGKLQLQENKITSGWISSKHQNKLHFGLDKQRKVDSILLVWPDGRQQKMMDVDANQIVDLDWEDALAPIAKPQEIASKTLKDVTQISGIDFVHQENVFSDFNTEKLIPHLLSTEGPKIAVGDVNSDGLEDIYICGAKGQNGELYLQSTGGGSLFSKRRNPVFEGHWVYEDTNATFFDADADGDLDLYVVSGGGEVFKGDVLRDRLYLNDGKGGFSYDKEKQLPNTEFNGSCAVPFDINGDGLVDLFVGNRSYPTKYGIPAASKFFLNRGQEGFIDASVSLMEHRGSIGMVTDAVWNEPEKELIIVGEWMPVTIYGFKEGAIERKKLENTSGWWNTVDLTDLDGDGQNEILLGNLGLNNDLNVSVNEPMDIYVHDFDGNLSTDPIISYYRNGLRWPYANLDLIAGQIVNVKRTYRTYKEYANSSFSKVFPDEQLKKAYHSQIQTLASSYLKSSEGSYDLKPLPEEFQYAPIYGFVSGNIEGNGSSCLLAIGNFNGNHPAMGRTSASHGTFMKMSQDGRFHDTDPNKTGFIVDGESRDIKIVKGPAGVNYIIVARNDNGVKVFSYGSH